MSMSSLHTLVAISENREALEQIRRKAESIFHTELVSPIMESSWNGACTFMVAPTGSHSGEHENETHVDGLDALAGALRAHADSDKPGLIEWFWIHIGEATDGRALVVECSGSADDSAFGPPT